MLRRTRCLIAATLLLLPASGKTRSPLTDSTDVRISNNREHEISVSVSPIDPNAVVVSNIVYIPGVPDPSVHLSAWVSTDGGLSWSSNATFPLSSADPAVAISANRWPSGRFLVNYLAPPSKTQYLKYKDLPGGSWINAPHIWSNPVTDANHLWVDNSQFSPLPPAGTRYHIYCGFEEAIGGNENPLNAISVARSLDDGIGWERPAFPPAPPQCVTYFYVNLQTGRTGRVYAIWNRKELPFRFGECTGAPTYDFAFKVSQNGAFTFTSDVPLGLTVDYMDRGSGLRNKIVRTAFTRPCMAVDRSDPAADHLYVVWADRQPGHTDILILEGVAALDDPNLQVTWSTSSISTVNQDVGQNDQWLPWITWDECTGLLAVAFMDSRNFASSNPALNQAGAETFVAVSPPPYRNGGQYSWTEVKVSDVSWRGEYAPLSWYEYLGMAAGDGRVFPVWSDSTDARHPGDPSDFRPYTSPILLWGVQQPSVATGFRNSMDGSISAITSWETNLDADTGDQFRLVSPSQQTFVTPEIPPVQDLDHGAGMTSLPCQEGTWSYVVSSRRSGCNFKRESDSVTLRIPFDAKMVPPITTDRCQGIAFGDYDGDGDADLYLTNKLGPNRLLSNEGRADIGGPGFGRFVDVTTAPLDNGDPSNAAAWGDYDNDGKLDLCLANGRLVPEGPAFANKLFRNLGAGNFVDATTGPLAIAEESRGVIWVDYDNDGKLDLFVVNHGVPCRLLRGDGTGAFTDVTSSPLTATNATAAAWADFDNDGDVDLYLVTDGTSMPSELFRNLGNGTFEQLGPPFYVLRDFGDGQSAAWGDHDNDRDLDLILVRSNGYRLFRNDGTSFVERPAPLSIDTCRGIARGDYDNDGDFDLYGTNDGPNQLYSNTNGTFSEVVDGVLSDPGNGRGVAWADYDGDGDVDLYFANDTGGNQSIRNTPCNPKHWLHVNLVGAADPVRTVAVSNRSAIGARVRAVVGALSRVQEISGGSGYGSQNSLTAEFGLGSSTLVDTVEVRWPGGEIRKEVQIAADQVLSVQEWIHGVQVTSTQFCQGTAKKWRIVVAWQTLVPTIDTDVLEIYPVSNCETGGPPYTIRTAPPQPGGVQHSVTYEGPCVVGAWKFTIRSSNGSSTAAELCRPVVVNSCPSCTNCPPTGCEIE